MQLTYHKVLKLAAILLFSFELLAPAVFASAELPTDLTSEQTNFASLSPSFDLFSHLIFEETSSEEEREGKAHAFVSISYIEVFNVLQKFKPTNTRCLLPTERFTTRPSLYTLHRVLLI